MSKKPKTSIENLVKFIKKYKQENDGHLPSVSDIARGTGVQRAPAWLQVNKFVQLGYLKRVSVDYSIYPKIDIP